MPENSRPPEWMSNEPNDACASRVLNGVAGGHDGLQATRSSDQTPPDNPIRRRRLSPEEYVQGVLDQDRTILARAMTLVESNAPVHMEVAQQVLKRLLPHSGNSIRIGITGVPGVGKSTFIEAFGCYLTRQGHRVAVLAVDPSSSVTRGSILGDKTRMERLSREENCFIRPSPSGGTLGGVTRKSRETMLVCEAAGFDVILLETVGVGQNEITVRSMVDCMLLLMIAGAGDELQGIKKGIVELADALVINKADGDNKLKAQAAQMEYQQALHYLSSFTEGWTSEVLTCSALTEEGVPEVWELVQRFRSLTGRSGVFERRRREQTRDWLHVMLEEELRNRFYRHPEVGKHLDEIETAVVQGGMPVTSAARTLLRFFDNTLA